MAEKKNPSQGYGNPYFRDQEKHYDGGERRINSPVDSVFSQSYLRKDGSNCMEDMLNKQLSGPSKKVVSKQKGGKK